MFNYGNIEHVLENKDVVQGYSFVQFCRVILNKPTVKNKKWTLHQSSEI